MVRRDNTSQYQEKPKSAEFIRRKRYYRCGLALQITLFFLIGFVWLTGVLGIIGGFIVGLNTQTISASVEPMDLLVTTPATVFIIYGIIFATLGTIGCLTSTGSNPVILTIFIILAIIVLIFDAVFGALVFFSTKSLIHYLKSLKSSMNDYGKAKADGVGIFRIDPSSYWDHLQAKGQCCGLDNYLDWMNVSLGKEKYSVPDTCCSRDYEYATCGDHIFRHPETKHHSIENLLNAKGCLKIFPKTLIESFEGTTYVGIAIGTVIILSILLTVALLCLEVFRKYKPQPGIERFGLMPPQPWSGYDRRGSRRVGPGSGDHHHQDNEQNRKVSFKGHSQFIPDKQVGAKDKTNYYNVEKRRNSQ